MANESLLHKPQQLSDRQEVKMSAFMMISSVFRSNFFAIAADGSMCR
jgi:hypothetical protein